MANLLLEVLPVAVVMVCYGLGGIGLLSVKTFDPLGASTYPLFLAAVSLALSAGVAFQSWSRRDVKRKETAKAALAPIILIAAETVVYLLLLDYAGFLLLTPFYIGAMLVTMGYKRYILAVITAIVITAVLYAMFGMLFRVLLPAGLLSHWVLPS